MERDFDAPSGRSNDDLLLAVTWPPGASVPPAAHDRDDSRGQPPRRRRRARVGAIGAGLVAVAIGAGALGGGMVAHGTSSSTSDNVTTAQPAALSLDSKSLDVAAVLARVE